MGFCTPREHEDFLRDAPTFEHMLGEAGLKIVKLWLDISKEEQAVRLDARRHDPLKALKVSELDGEAQKRWKAYSEARNQMLLTTSTMTLKQISYEAGYSTASHFSSRFRQVTGLTPSAFRGLARQAT